jgi:anthranilate phosphoribosyltransferase
MQVRFSKQLYGHHGWSDHLSVGGGLYHEPVTQGQASGEFMTQPTIDLQDVLKHLHAGGTLDQPKTIEVFGAMMSGLVDNTQIASLLSLLATRIPTTDELVGAAQVMRQHVTHIPTSIPPEKMLDTAGTGGAPKTFNVSTAAAIIAASAGIPTAKHGNRSRTGRGSAEVLDRLGINLDASPEVQARCLELTGTCFCFAIRHHPATRYVVPVRKSLGFPTIFNLLGPLTNPAGARRQLMGIWDASYGQVVSEGLRALDSVEALVAHSHDGLDELSISAPTTLWHVCGGDIEQFDISPELVGLETADRSLVTANTLDDAVSMVRSVLNGSEQGPPRSMVLLNAAAAMWVGGGVNSLKDGVGAAVDEIDSGRSMQTLEHLAAVSHGS